MIDIHCHILPQIDDGAYDIEESLNMARLAVESSVKAIIATPHCNVPNEPNNYYDSYYKQAFNQLKEAIEKEQLPLKLMEGMEVFVTFDLPNLIKEGKVITLNNSRYILTEFNFDEDPDFVEIMVERIKDLKLIPVIAHPERYEFVKNDIDFAQRLVNKGCLLQANKGSFLGNFGKSAQAVANSLLEKDLFSVIASDAHSSQHRTPYLLDTASTLKDVCDIKKLFINNPLKICNNQPI